jgi:hypothetical protein
MAGILALLGAVTFGALWFGLRIVRKVARVKR